MSLCVQESGPILIFEEACKICLPQVAKPADFTCVQLVYGHAGWCANLWFRLRFFNKEQLHIFSYPSSSFPFPPPTFPLPLFLSHSSCPQVMAKHTTSSKNWPTAQSVWLLLSMRHSLHWKPSPSCVHCPSTRGTVRSSSTLPCCHQEWGRKDTVPQLHAIAAVFKATTKFYLNVVVNAAG